MQYGMNDSGTILGLDEASHGGMMTTSAGICFGAPDQATDSDAFDAAPAAACAAENKD